MQIPWAKLYIDEKELQEVVDCIKSTWLAKGPKVEQFEAKVKALIGAKHCIAVNNGTSALDVALKVLDIKPGDEVIVPAMAYIATTNSVLYQHAVPVFADIDPRTFCLDAEEVRKKITARTRAIIAIDYAGQGADYKKLREVVQGKNIYIVEDAAPSFGGEQHSRKLCTFGDMAITSFHLAKTFTAVEGGMIFTDNDAWATKARIILNQGESSEEKYLHPYVGHNYRLSDLHASVGLAQVSRFEEVLRKRAELAGRYTREFNQKSSKINTPIVLPENKHAWFLYPVLVEQRDVVFKKLKEAGIQANVSWPRPVYKQPAYAAYAENYCPVAEEITKKILCLPMYFAMTEEEQEYVIKKLVEIVEDLH